MTKGRPWRLIAGFALPVLLSQIFQQLYTPRTRSSSGGSSETGRWPP